MFRSSQAKFVLGVNHSFGESALHRSMRHAAKETRRPLVQRLLEAVSLARTKVDRGSESQTSRSQVFAVSEAHCIPMPRPEPASRRACFRTSAVTSCNHARKPCASRSPLGVESPRKKQLHRAPRQLTPAPTQQMQLEEAFAIWVPQPAFPAVPRMSPLVREKPALSRRPRWSLRAGHRYGCG
jgi:hypothetical protein